MVSFKKYLDQALPGCLIDVFKSSGIVLLISQKKLDAGDRGISLPFAEFKDLVQRTHRWSLVFEGRESQKHFPSVIHGY